MGFWHLYMGIYGGGGGAVASVYPALVHSPSNHFMYSGLLVVHIQAA